MALSPRTGIPDGFSLFENLLLLMRRYVTDKTAPTDTPMIAPAEPPTYASSVLRSTYASAHPRISFDSASMTCETAVYVMMECPWKYPLREDITNAQNAVTARTLIDIPELGLFIMAAKMSAPKNMAKAITAPIIVNILVETLYIRTASSVLPATRVSLIILETATGRPADASTASIL